MISKHEICGLLELYKSSFPGESGSVRLFYDYLHATEYLQLFDRKNFSGHITTSAFIVDIAKSEMLLLRHKSLDRWLQPGGHAEMNDASLIHAALREAVEETGIAANQLTYIPAHQSEQVPFDIDSHFISPNDKKAEPGHYHHDQRYLFAYTGERENEYDPAESTGMKWVSFDELARDPVFARVAVKIGGLKKVHLI
jgi:8-oxo-dGTP pyrophosphatase MutT (NUDIX family)